MGDLNKLNPIDTAHHFIKKYFPNCQGALLAGSVIPTTLKSIYLKWGGIIDFS